MRTEEKENDLADNPFIPDNQRPVKEKKSESDPESDPKDEPAPWEAALAKDGSFNIEGSDIQLWKQGDVFTIRKGKISDALELSGLSLADMRVLGKFFTRE